MYTSHPYIRRLQSKGVYERMAWILRNSGNEEHDGGMERVAAPKNTDVYLEAVETTENKNKELETAWYA